jgi:hypothetical protein
MLKYLQITLLSFSLPSSRRVETVYFEFDKYDLDEQQQKKS